VPKKSGHEYFWPDHEFFGTDFAIIANLIRIFGPDSRMDRSEGNLNRGFSMKNYPDFYFPSIIPALGHVVWSKTIFKHVPPSISSCWFFSPTPPIHFCILNHVPCSSIALLYFTLQQCCWRGTSPVTIYVHSKKLLAMDHTMKCC